MELLVVGCNLQEIGIPSDEESPLRAYLVRSIYSSFTLWTIPSDRPPPRLSLFTPIPRPSKLQPIETSPVCLVRLVVLVCFVYLVSCIQQNKQDKPNKPNTRNRPNEQDSQAGPTA
jgi:hypothetical protein